jgi:hypothetical protein
MLSEKNLQSRPQDCPPGLLVVYQLHREKRSQVVFLSSFSAVCNALSKLSCSKSGLINSANEKFIYGEAFGFGYNNTFSVRIAFRKVAAGISESLPAAYETRKKRFGKFVKPFFICIE